MKRKTQKKSLLKQGNDVFIPILQWTEGKGQGFETGSANRGISVLKQKITVKLRKHVQLRIT